MADYIFISIKRQTKQKFEDLKREFSDNPECKDDEFLVELMDFALEKLNQAE